MIMSRVMRKTGFLHMRKQRRRSASAKLISVYYFSQKIVQSIYFLNLNFQACSHLLWPYSLVRVGPCRKPRRLVFSRRGSLWSSISVWLKHLYIHFSFTDQLKYILTGAKFKGRLVRGYNLYIKRGGKEQFAKDYYFITGDPLNPTKVSIVIVPNSGKLNIIMKTCPCNEHPLTPHLYIGKLGFTGVYIFFSYFCSKT